ncbi:hypothetical protein ACHAXR_009457, partial [Thalassiosira sp. AJA248-18]
MTDNNATTLDLAEALAITPFATLAGQVVVVGGGGDNNAAPAARADPHGRTIMCSPPPTATTTTIPPGIVFRIGDNNGTTTVEAIQISPPTLSSGGQNEEEGGEGEGEEEAVVTGGTMTIIGTLDLPTNNPQQQQQVVVVATNMACSNDARLLLIGYSDGTLLCLNISFGNQQGSGEIGIQFSQRWTIQTATTSSTTASSVNNDENSAVVQFPTLEFLPGDDERHQFLAVVEVGGGGDGTTTTNQTLWMDATASSPTINLWPLPQEGDTVNGHITCATCRPPPPSDAAVDNNNNAVVIAFGTNTGTLGIYSEGNVHYINHPLLEQQQDDDDDEEGGPWKITHLNWFHPQSLAVGLSRVIVNPEDDDDDDDDEEDEDDPNDHQANLLIGTLLSNNNDATTKAWTWSELGDVVPFFSVPKGGRHVFHTATLPYNASSSSGGSSTMMMLLVGANVGNDVAILCQQQQQQQQQQEQQEQDGSNNNLWEMLELMEGSQMSCPTDTDDEFLYLMGLTVVMLPLLLVERQGRTTTGVVECQHPFPLLASTDGSLMGFVPQHRTMGDKFFASIGGNGGGGGGGGGVLTEEMGVPIPMSLQPRQEAPTSAGPLPLTNDANEDGDGCILSGLDLGLDSVNDTATNNAGRFSLNAAALGNNDDDDDEISCYDYGDKSTSDSSLDSIDGDDNNDDGQKVAQEVVPVATTAAFMGGMSAPSFSFGGGTFGGGGGTFTNTTTPTTTKAVTTTTPAFGSAFGGGGGFGSGGTTTTTTSTFGSAFGVTATTFGAAVDRTPDSSSQKPITSPVATSTPVFGSGSAPVFGSGGAATSVFGSGSTQPKLGGFGALASAASAADTTKGFGSGVVVVKAEEEEDKKKKEEEKAKEPTKEEKTKEAASSSSAAFPPMSAAAPKPFGASLKKEESKATEKVSSSSAAFPPMSAAAPKNPFSTKPTGAAFPPMSAAAPKPFGAPLKKEESKATEKASSSSAAFPPMSKSAPSPFGAFSKTSAPSTTEKSSAPPSAFGSGAATTAMPSFGSGSAIPSFGFKSSGGGFASSFGTIGTTSDSTSQSPKPLTNPFGAFGGTNAFGSTSSSPSSKGPPGMMVKPLFGEKQTQDKVALESASLLVPQSSPPSKEDDGLDEYLQTSPGKKAMGVFNTILADTEGSDSSLLASNFESLVDEIGEGFHGDELDKQLALVDPDGSGVITSAAFVKWYCNFVDQEGDESSQESEIAEEKANAEEAFDAVSEGSTKIPASEFGKLLESMGTTYCEEEHVRTIKKISSSDESSGDKVIMRKAFVDWYIDWLFGDGESSDEESMSDGAEEGNERESAKEVEGKADGWGSMFKASEEGSWKCGVCLVANKPSSTTCAACETPKPGEEGKSADLASAAKPMASGSIGAGGFSFGGALPSTDNSATSSGGSAFGS